MRKRGRVILAVFVLSLALIAGVTGGTATVADDRVHFTILPEDEVSAPIAPPDFESTERLVLSGGEATPAAGEVGIDPTTATGRSFGHLEVEYNAQILEEEMRQANTSQEELALVRTELERLEVELDDALATEEESYEALAAGEMDGDTFVRELGLIYHRSEILNAELQALANAVRGVTTPVTQDEGQRLRGEISQTQLETRTLQGPVSEASAAALVGDSQLISPVEIRANDRGYVAAGVLEDTWVRQAYAVDNRNRGAGGGFSDHDAGRDIVEEFYPWTIAEAEVTEDVPRGEIFSSTIEHPQGTTGIFVDGSTERPFRDQHALDLFSMPTVEEAAVEEDGLGVVVDRTYVGGPTQIEVFDTESGDPIGAATVRVNNQTVGETASDGTVWLVAPSATFELTVAHDGTEVVVPVNMP